jgi:hypothetical protein
MIIVSAGAKRDPHDRGGRGRTNGRQINGRPPNNAVEPREPSVVEASDRHGKWAATRSRTST